MVAPLWQLSVSSQHMVKRLTLNLYMSLCNLKLCTHIWSTNINFRPSLHWTFRSVFVWTFTLCHGRTETWLLTCCEDRGATKNSTTQCYCIANSPRSTGQQNGVFVSSLQSLTTRYTRDSAQKASVSQWSNINFYPCPHHKRPIRCILPLESTAAQMQRIFWCLSLTQVLPAGRELWDKLSDCVLLLLKVECRG